MKRTILQTDVTGIDDETLKWFRSLKPVERAEVLSLARQGRGAPKPAVLGITTTDGRHRRYALPNGVKDL